MTPRELRVAGWKVARGRGPEPFKVWHESGGKRDTSVARYMTRKAAWAAARRCHETMKSLGRVS